MSWICWDLDGVLLNKTEEGDLPVEGAIETVGKYVSQGHRNTVVTTRFIPMPESEKQRLKEELEQSLAGMGFPPLEIWTGTNMPACDFYVSKTSITFDDDFPLLQAQLDYMVNEQSSMTMNEGDPNVG